MFAHLRKLDWPLILAVLLLSGVGLLTMYGIGTEEAHGFFTKQAYFLGFGLAAMLALSFLDYRIFKNSSWLLIILYISALGVLISVLFAGQIRGASSWFKFGPLQLEPIEFIKIIAIMIMAKYLSMRHIEMYRIRHLIISGGYVCLLAIAALLQPDMGSAFILFAIWLGMVLVSGIKLRHLLLLFLALVVLSVGSWLFMLEDYQKQRLMTFINPEADPYGQGYHISQSLIAIGSGRVMGQGAQDSSQAGLKFLPEQHNDFIFATLSEQRGLVGVLGLLLLYAFLFYRLIKIIFAANNNFARLFVAGVVILIFIQALVSIGMNMAMLPVTGLNLPFVSYGGSSLLSLFITIGIVQSIKTRI